MTTLSQKSCIPCKGGVPKLSGKELRTLHNELDSGWDIIDDHHLEKEFSFSNFRKGLEFTNRVGELAEEQKHHPDIFLAWGKVRIQIWTHKIDGLTESDFILAAKIEEL